MEFRANILIAAFIGGLLGAVLSIIPFVSYGCCVWTALGGGLSAFVYLSLNKQEKLESVDGIAAGGLAGVCSAFLIILLNVVLAFFVTGAYFGIGAITSIASNDLTPLVMLGSMGVVYSIIMAFMILALAFFYTLLFGLLGAVGGAVAGSLLYKK